MTSSQRDARNALDLAIAELAPKLAKPVTGPAEAAAGIRDLAIAYSAIHATDRPGVIRITDN